MAIATAAKQIIVDGQSVAVAGGQENISAVQNAYLEWVANEKDASVIARTEHAYMPMLLTAEHVAKTYDISREQQDAYAAQSQARTAAAQEAGRFDAEIVPITAIRAMKNKETGEVTHEETTLSKDEGTDLERPPKHSPALSRSSKAD